jgi:hypothetical protein
MVMIPVGSRIYFGIRGGVVINATENHAIIRFDDGKITHIVKDDLEGTEVI